MRDPLEVIRCALQDTIGFYCSFCEMPVYVEEGVASRFLRDLKSVPTLAEWDDLLLTCDWCRHYRRGDVSNAGEYLWPDIDATFALDGVSPFHYTLREVDYVVQDADANVLQSSRQTVSLITAGDPRAQNAIDLFQLNTAFFDQASNRFTVIAPDRIIDRRVDLRTRAWLVAQNAAAALRDAKASSEPSAYRGMVPLIASLAQATGFWSVWMTVFWAALHDRDVIRDVLLEIDQRDAYQVVGYQTFPDGGKPPWKIFTGTAVDRIAF